MFGVEVSSVVAVGDVSLMRDNVNIGGDCNTLFEHWFGEMKDVVKFEVGDPSGVNVHVLLSDGVWVGEISNGFAGTFGARFCFGIKFFMVFSVSCKVFLAFHLFSKSFLHFRQTYRLLLLIVKFNRLISSLGENFPFDATRFRSLWLVTFKSHI